MSDLSELQAAQITKIIGSTPTGVETTPIGGTNGSLHTQLRDNGGSPLGTVTNPIYTNGAATVFSPLPSLKVVRRAIVPAGITNLYTENIVKKTAIREFTFGGRRVGEGILGKYFENNQLLVPGGNFNSPADVALWTNTGNGDGSSLILSYSTVQAFEGTGSLRLGPATKSDANHFPEISYFYPTPISLDSWRYVTARFYNNPASGGSVTRTISIRLLDSSGRVAIYSISGPTTAAPFNTAGWIQILGQLITPTSIAADFDMNSISRISLRMQDSGNKSYTAIYWDNVFYYGEIDIIQKIYSNGPSIRFPFDPIVQFDVGDVIYLAIKSNDVAAAEFQITAAGVDIT
jgi:hypothetical protein